MEYRSTNPVGFVHFGGDLIAGAGSSHGVKLSGGSTGGVVETIADDTSASLTIRAKGAGPVVIGNSSQAVTFAGSGVKFGTSTATIKGIYYFSTTVAQAAISSGAIAELTYKSTSCDVVPGDMVTVTMDGTLLSAPIIYGGFRLSTAADSRLTVLLAVPGSSASASVSGNIYVNWLDLT